MLKKNDILKLDITDITSLGFGVGRHEGLVVFASGAVTGDLAEVKIIKANRSYAIARTERIITPSPHRCSENCKNNLCKSCAYKEISYLYEISLKENTIRGAFISEGLDHVKLDSVTPSPKKEEYRNKAQYPVSINKDGEFTVGFTPLNRTELPRRQSALSRLRSSER